MLTLCCLNRFIRLYESRTVRYREESETLRDSRYRILVGPSSLLCGYVRDSRRFLEGRPYRKEYLIAHKGRLAGAGAYAYTTRQ
jgi:hypothetical protein